MKVLFALLSLLLGLAGCAKTREKDSAQYGNSGSIQSTSQQLQKKSSEEESKPIITPDDSPAGKIITVNRNARFAVMNFSSGNIPPPGRRLNVYRDGLKVAEIKVTGPQQDFNTVGDIIAGEAQANDEVKEN